MARARSLGSPRTVLDRAIRVHLVKLADELREAATADEPPWSVMARTARSLARLGTSGPPAPLDFDADDGETARYYRILRLLAQS
jgi:hypothetical protein